MGVVSRTSGETTTASTSHPITLPGGILAGDQIVLVFTQQHATTDGAQASENSAAWDRLDEQWNGTSTNLRGTLFHCANSAAGGSSVTITTTTAQTATWLIYVVRNGSGVIHFVGGAGGDNTVATVQPNTGRPSGRYVNIIALGVDSNKDGFVPHIEDANVPVNTTVDPDVSYTRTERTPADNTADSVSTLGVDAELVGITGVSSPSTLRYSPVNGTVEQWVSFNILIPVDEAVSTETHKFYLQNAPAGFVPGTRAGSWDAFLGVAVSAPFRLGDTPEGASANRGATESSPTAGYDVLLSQFVSAPASADGSVVGDYEVVLGRVASHADAQMVFSGTLWITEGNTGTLRTGVTLLGANAWPTAVSGYRLAGTLPELAFFAGDRLVFESGYRADNVISEDRWAYVYHGGTSTTDMAPGDTDMNRPGHLSVSVTPGVDFVETENLTPPGSVFPLDNWKMTVHLEDPSDPGDADEILQPELDTYRTEWFKLNQDNDMVMVAPVQGVTTGGSDATRTELREMQGGAEASWSLLDAGVRQLTATLIPDPTGSTDRREMIVMQIHAGAEPAVYLAAEWESNGVDVTPRIRLYGESDGITNILSPINNTDPISLRIRVENQQVLVYAEQGGPENLITPKHTFVAADFTDTEGWYLKTGPYNKSTVVGGGGGDVRATFSFLELIQPGPPPTVGAGADVASHTVSTAFTRTATENDNGSAITSRVWSITAGPTGVGTTIGTAAALSWTPTQTGVYTLQYSAQNGGGIGSDTVSVTVVAGSGGGGSLDLQLVGSSAWSYGGNAAGNPAPLAYPTGIAENDVVYLVLHNKSDPSLTGGSVLEPPDQTGWSKIGTAASTGGTFGADTGPTRITLYRRLAPAGGLSGAVDVSLSGNNALLAVVRAYRAVNPGTGLTYSEDWGSFARNSASTTMGGTVAPALDLRDKDRLAFVLGSATDDQVVTSGPSVSASGATFGSVAKSPNANGSGTSGNDVGAAAWDVPVTSGSSSTGPAITATAAVSATGIGFAWRVRATDDGGGGSSPPVVDAGSDVSSWPIGQAYERTATVDAGDGAFVARGWEIISGPTNVGDTVSTAGVSFTPSQAGTWVFEFTYQTTLGTDSDTFSLTAVDAASRLPAHAGEALWIGDDAGKNHFNLGVGEPGGGELHTDYSQSQVESGDADRDPEFKLLPSGNVQFHIQVDRGRTSPNTKFPRSECRELNTSGGLAAWNGSSGRHYMKGRSRVTHVSEGRPWVCFFQIHDDDSDLMRCQTEDGGGGPEGLRLKIRWTPVIGGPESSKVVMTSYALNQWVEWEVEINAGRLRVWLDGVEVLNETGLGRAGCYFKFGCYAQSSVNDLNDTENGDTSQYFRVEVEKGSVETWHTGYPAPTEPVFTGAALDRVIRRFYLANMAARNPLTQDFTWVDDDTNTATPFQLTESPFGIPTSISRSETTTETPWWVTLARWISDPVTTSGKIFGNWVATFGIYESEAGADFFPYINVYIKGRGTVISTVVSNAELPATAQAFRWWGQQGSGSGEITLQPGDQLIVDVGYRASNAVTTSYSATLHYGGTAFPDLEIPSTAFDRPGWVEFEMSPGMVFDENYEPPTENTFPGRMMLSV